MTARDDLDRQLDAYLRDGPDELPEPSYYAVRDRTESARQRVVIGPWRLPEMNKIVTIGLSAAAVVLLIFVGAQLFGAPSGGLGAPDSEPTATALPEATASTPGAEASGEPTNFATVPQGSRLEEGEYVFTHLPGVRVAFTVSSNWERNIPNWMVWSTDDDKATMGAFTVDNVVIDPCQPDLGFQDPAVGSTVDDLVTVLRAVPGITFSAPVNVTQDGYAGVRLDYVPPDEFGNCLPDMGEAMLLTVEGSVPATADFLAAPTGTDAFSLLIYDVNGTRVVIAAAYTSSRAAELDAMLGSIRFESP